MATIQGTTDRNTANGVIIVNWALGNADDGAPFTIPFPSSITFQASGTFGAATVVLEGSNDGTNWTTLNAVAGSTCSLTALGLRKAVEEPVFVRARSSGGTGSAIVATLAIRPLFDRKGY